MLILRRQWEVILNRGYSFRPIARGRRSWRRRVEGERGGETEAYHKRHVM